MLNLVLLIIIVAAFSFLAVFAYRNSYKSLPFISGALAALLIVAQIKNFSKHFSYLINTVSVSLFLCSILCIFCFLFSYFTIRRISKATKPTKKQVLRRARMIRGMRYALALAISFFAVSISFPSYIDPENLTNTNNWIYETIKFAFLSTMALMLIDGIVSRLCSAIYTVEHIKHLEQFNLYLRSFEADTTHETDEKVICKTFNHLFPTYAIGAPNAVLQPNGAERIYATDSEWQDAVSCLMEKAQVIIVRCGLTDGTIWEIQRILSSSYIGKCIFVIDSKSQLDYLKTELQKIDIVLDASKIDFAMTQCGIYLYKEENGSWITFGKSLTNSEDVETIINEVLKHNHSVDEVYSKVLDIRHHSLKKIFSNDIPKKVKYSLNLGIASPIINMRDWTLNYWVLFGGICIIGVLLFNSVIPTYVVLLILLLIGNRIEWTLLPYSGPIMFLKKQRREAYLMWFSMLSTIIIVLLCILLTTYYGQESGIYM